MSVSLVKPYDVDNISTIADFLSRPQFLTTMSWTVGSPFNSTFDPWSTFLNSPSIARKIANFARFKGNLRIRIMINTNSFYFGSLIASYVPLPDEDQITLARTYSAPVSADFIEIMQRPHVLIDPSCSEDREMVLPFFYPLPYYPLTLETKIGFSSIGKLCFNSLNTLQHANGSTDPVVVTVMGHIEDLDLTLPTSYVSVSEITRDKKVGPATNFFSQAKSITKLARQIPALAPFSTPLDATAQLGYALSKSFGLSREENTTPIIRIQENLLPELSCVDRPDLAEKLSLTSSNQLAIDPASFGVKEDTMDIHSLTRDFGYIYTSQIGTSAAGTVLASVRVRPILSQVNSLETHYPRISYCSLPFRYWRGMIRYKFQVIGSAFHRGRIRITWDPYPSNNDTTGYYNAVYTKILDLADQREVIMDIPYFHSNPFLPTVTSGTVVSNTTLLPTSADNGTINVTVLNSVNSPNTTSFQPIYLNVYIASGDDFSLFQPSDTNLKTLTFFSASAVEITPVDEEKEEEVTSLVSSQYPITLTAMGECVLSLRSLLKRSAFHSFIHRYLIGPSSVFALQTSAYSLFDRPYFRGHDLNGITTTGTNYMWNFCNNSFLSFFEPLYVARRGSYKTKYVTLCRTSNSTSSTADLDVVTLTRDDYLHTSPSGRNVAHLTLNANSSEAAVAATFFGSNTAPAITGSCNPQQVRPRGLLPLDVSLPYYGPLSFLPARTISNPSTASSALLNGNSHTLAIRYHTQSTTAIVIGVSRYVAIGEDYSLAFPLSTPVLYSQADPSPV